VIKIDSFPFTRYGKIGGKIGVFFVLNEKIIQLNVFDFLRTFFGF